MLLTLPEALNNYKIHVLARMARATEIDVPDRRKETLVNALAHQLGTPEVAARAWARLNSREIAVLQRLQAVDGEVRSAGLKQELVRAGLVTDSPNTPGFGRYGPPPTNTFEAIMSKLMECGLVLTREPVTFSTRTSSSLIALEPGAVLWIPAETRRHLPPPPEAKPRALQIQTTREGSARVFQRDLYLYWSYLREKPLTPTQALWVRKSDLRTINDALLVKTTLGVGQGEKDARRLFFLRRLLQELEMLSHRRNQVLANEQAAFLGMEATARVKRCFELWHKGRFWNEIFGLTNVALRTNDTPIALAHAGVVSARATVLRHVSQMASDDWVLADTLVDRLHNQDFEFLLPRGRRRQPQPRIYVYGGTSSPYVTNPYGWVFDRVFDEDSGWYRIDAEFALTVVREGLYWLGLVDLGYGPDTPNSDNAAQPPPGFTAYRLTDMGRWLLAKGPMPHISTDSGRVIVQPNFDVFALDPVSDVVLAALDQFCERLSAERAVHYRITRQSVYRGSRRGWHVPRIIEFLNVTSSTPMPQNVERDLREWATMMERVVVRTHVALLQAAQPSLLDQVVREETIANAVTSRPGSDVVLLKAGAAQVDAVYKALLLIGQLPTRTRTDLATASPSLTLAPDGVITFRRRLPSIHQMAQIEPFCEQNAAGIWQVTAAAVRHAIDNGWTAASILDALRALNIGPLPPRFDLKVKAWAGHFGKARIQTLTLVQFEANRILDELLDDPDISPLLTRFVTADPSRALAVVDSENENRLRTLLTERGVVFKGAII